MARYAASFKTEEEAQGFVLKIRAVEDSLGCISLTQLSGEKGINYQKPEDFHLESLSQESRLCPRLGIVHTIVTVESRIEFPFISAQKESSDSYRYVVEVRTE